jgi:hypothetical protein
MENKEKHEDQKTDQKKLMQDTPQHIKDLQLKNWLSKPPGERLLIAIKTNEELFLFFKKIKEQNKL